MIGQLRGVLRHKELPWIVLDVSGVGYEVQVTLTLYCQLPLIDYEITIYTHFSVREDAQSLYGFASREERDMFRGFLRISGVGPKLALSLMSTLSVEECVACIRNADTTSLSRVPGVGKKTAERIVIEMRDWIKQQGWVERVASISRSPHENSVAHDPRQQILFDAESALVGLGYKQPIAEKAIRTVQAQAQTPEELVRLALRSLAQR
ncbi:MAG: Holliday junction branch migration protein RuvA [Pseudomonadota bacterium]